PCPDSFLSLLPFFFYHPAPHLDLHSFPTRRSSDLWFRPGSSRALPQPSPRSPASPCAAWRSGAAGHCPPIAAEPGRPRPKRTARSEEHTSELQSQSNLVCRLLLEKKKKPTIFR